MIKFAFCKDALTAKKRDWQKINTSSAVSRLVGMLISQVGNARGLPWTKTMGLQKREVQERYSVGRKVRICYFGQVCWKGEAGRDGPQDCHSRNREDEKSCSKWGLEQEEQAGSRHGGRQMFKFGYVEMNSRQLNKFVFRKELWPGYRCGQRHIDVQILHSSLM